MNYAPNTTQWKPGDIVIHDFDAKREYMLMEVINYTRNGMVRTVYCDKGEQRRWGSRGRSRLINPLCMLHDPERFGIDVTKLKDTQCK